MKGLRKKAVVLAAAATLAMSSLAGCASDCTVDNDKVAVVVGDSEIKLGLLNFYLRYQQAGVEEMYTSALGEDVWKIVATENGATYEEVEKETAVTALVQSYVLEDHMDEYGVTITEDELAEIEKAADAFVEANGEDAALVSGDKEIIKEILKLCKINKKMYSAMIADVSTEVDDEEAAQKRIAYLGFTESEDVTLEEAKEAAAAFLEEAKKNGSLLDAAEAQGDTGREVTFDSQSETLVEVIVEAADKLKEGEFADVITVDNYYYVIQLVSEFDEEATEEKKVEIVETRQYEEYERVYTEWQDATEITVYDDVITEISMHRLKVTEKTEE